MSIQRTILAGGCFWGMQDLISMAKEGIPKEFYKYGFRDTGI